MGSFLGMKQWSWSELCGQFIHLFCWSSINFLQEHLTHFCKDSLWVQSPAMSMLLNTDRDRDWPLALRPTGVDWLVFILFRLHQHYIALGPGSPQGSTSQESHCTTYLFCVSQFKVHKEVRWLFCSPPEWYFHSMKQKYAWHIPQYGLREKGGLSIPSQQALHYRPIQDDSFFAAFFPLCPPEQPLSEPFTEQYSGFVLKKASQSSLKEMGSD